MSTLVGLGWLVLVGLCLPWLAWVDWSGMACVNRGWPGLVGLGWPVLTLVGLG